MYKWVSGQQMEKKNAGFTNSDGSDGCLKDVILTQISPRTYLACQNTEPFTKCRFSTSSFEMLVY